MKTASDQNNKLRRAAEARLQSRPAARPRQTEAQWHRLRHELEVHQIELEMQNEELRTSKAEIEAVLERFTDFYDFAPVGYFDLTSDGTIRLVNLPGAKLLGLERAGLLGRRFQLYLPEADRPAFNAFLQQTFATRAIQTCEIAVVRKDGTLLNVHLEATLASDGQQCRMATLNITEHKRAEEALQASERKYRRLYESLTDAFVSVSMSGQIQEFNPAYRNLLGYPDEELLRLTYEDLTPEKWHAFEAAIVQQQILPHGFSEVYEKEYRRKDGTIFPVELRTLLIKDDAGRATGMWALVRDITQRKEIEAALRKSEERFRALTDLSPDIISIFDGEGRLVFNSSAAAKIHGYQAHELEGRSTFDFIHPDDRRDVENAFDRLLKAQDELANVQYRYRNADGSYKWMEAFGRNELTNPHIRGIIAISRDISERKRAEAELLTSEQQLRLALEASNAGTWSWDVAANLSTWDDNYHRLYGFKPDEKRSFEAWIGRVHPQDRERLLAQIQALIQPSGDDSWNEEFRALIPDAGERWMAGLGHVERNEDGTARRLMGLNLDITERKRAEAALARSHEQYRRAIIAANAIPYQKDYRADAYVFMAEGIKALTGYAPAELCSAVWKKIVLETVYLGDAADLPAAEVVRRVLAGKLMNWQADHRIRTRSGEIRWITDASIAIRDPAGKYIGSIGIIQDITERKQAEVALRRAHDELEQRVLERTAELNQANMALQNELMFSERVIITAQMIILILDKEARIVRFNPYMEQLSGYRLAEVQGKNWFKTFLPATDWKRIRGFFQKALFGSPTQGIVNPIRLKDGTLRQIEWHDAPLKDAQGRVTGLVAFGRDITERRQAEEQLRISEERFRAIAANTPDHILIQDLNLRYRLVINPQLGLTEADMLGKTDRDLFKNADAGYLTAIKKKVLETGRPLHVETPFSNLKGELEFFEGDYIPRRDATGKVDGLIGYFRNVTERHQAEESLRKSEERFRVLFTSSQDALMTLEPPAWRFTSGNPAAVEMFRTGDVHRLLATAPWELSPEFQPDGRPSKKAAQAMIGTAKRQGSHYFEWRHRRLDGEEFPASVLLTRVELGGQMLLQATVRDISQHREAEKRITQFNRVKFILAGIDRAIVHIHDQQKLLEEICRVTVGQGGFKLVWVGMVAPDGSVQPVAKAGQTGYLKGIRVVVRDEPVGRGPAGLAIRENRPVVIPDIERDARMSPWLDRARKFGLRYVAALPLRIADKVVGAILAYAPQADFFAQNELSLMTQVSNEVSVALTAMADFKARKQAEAKLRQNEAQLQAIMDNSPALIFLKDRRGRYLHFNGKLTESFHLDAKQCLGKTAPELFPADQVKLARANELKMLKAGTAMNFLEVTTQDNTPHTNIVTRFPLRDARGKIYAVGGIVTDITERINLEKEILNIGERESRRIAQDLHDGLGQLLVGANYLTSTLRKELAEVSAPATRRLDRIQEVINEAIAQTRNLARGVQPVEPEPNGLMVALEKLAGQTRKTFRIRCDFKCRQPVLLEDNKVATHLFRIAQEAVTNAVKHGRSKRILIRLTRTASRINLAVKDDGVGLPARRRKKSGMGLNIMRYRAGIIGGALVIQKNPAGGTAVVCRVQLSSENKPKRERSATVKKD